jgi:iron(III) transport system permease protein
VGAALLVAAAVAGLTVAAALTACWLARGSPWFGGLLAGLVVLAAPMPGPIVGLGLKDAIEQLLVLTGSEELGQLLYHGPSWTPVIWAQTIRLFPLAAVLLWPAVRSLPRSLFESARLDGASPLQEFVRIVLPLTFRPACLAAAVIAALSLGEIGASKIVSTPGAQTFCELLFMQLHKGVDGDVAALSLLLLLAVSALAAIVAVLRRWS